MQGERGVKDARRVKAARGFSLLEVLVAVSILTAALSALAGLCVTATRANVVAGSMSVATILAGQKMEQLRALDWDAVAPSADDALVRNVPGACDFLDAAGRPLGGDGDAPPGAVYLRRWSIVPLPAEPEAAVVIQVRVMRAASRLADAPLPPVPGPEEVRLVGVRARKAD